MSRAVLALVLSLALFALFAFAHDELEGRMVGDAAKSQASSNPINAVRDMKRFIGRKFTDPQVHHESIRTVSQLSKSKSTGPTRPSPLKKSPP